MIITQHAEQRARERYNLSLYAHKDNIFNQFRKKQAKPIGRETSRYTNYLILVNDIVITVGVRSNPMRIITVLDTDEYVYKVSKRKVV
jgi:hypothetical protein